MRLFWQNVHEVLDLLSTAYLVVMAFWLTANVIDLTVSEPPRKMLFVAFAFAFITVARLFADAKLKDAAL